MASETITTRLPEDLVEQLEEVSKAEHAGKSEVLRKMLADGLQQWRVRRALDLYQQGIFSFGQAARFAQVSVWKFPDLLKVRQVHLQFDLEELQQEFRSLGWS